MGRESRARTRRIAAGTALLALTLIASMPHDLHVVYGRMGIEGRVVQAHLRFFHHDLELALRGFSGDERFRLEASPVADSVFTAYMDARFRVRVGSGRATDGTAANAADAVAGASADAAGVEAGLPATILSSGEESDAGDRVWWYVVGWDSPRPVDALSVHNRLLFEVFDDQRNILRVQHFPSGKQQTYYLVADAPEARFSVE